MSMADPSPNLLGGNVDQDYYARYLEFSEAPAESGAGVAGTVATSTEASAFSDDASFFSWYRAAPNADQGLPEAFRQPTLRATAQVAGSWLAPNED
jgi:hypothetical protein